MCGCGTGRPDPAAAPISSGLAGETYSEFLERVNENHSLVSWEGEDGDISEWLRKPVENVDPAWNLDRKGTGEKAKYDAAAMLTIPQAEEDIEYLFDSLQNTYGLYDYFGGLEVFKEAEETILQQCGTNAELSCSALEQILLENLSFVQDGHFLINQKSLAGREIPFFCREIPFFKNGSLYQTEDGRVVVSAEGYEDLDELMRCSLSEDGRIVYYPVWMEKIFLFSSEDMDKEYFCEAAPVLHYEDGGSQVLTAEPFSLFWDGDRNNNFSLEWKDGIPVLRIYRFSMGGDRKLMGCLKELEQEPVLILDMRSNEGGNPAGPISMVQKYAGHTVEANTQTVNAWTGEPYEKKQKNFVENDRLLILLVGKYTASAAEMFIDLSYNLENVVIIGENTCGAFLGDAARRQLPNSRISVTAGDFAIHIPPAYGQYYEELRGFYPDLWIPAEEAEEAALRFIQGYFKSSPKEEG